jgi:hypothetical protein
LTHSIDTHGKEGSNENPGRGSLGSDEDSPHTSSQVYPGTPCTHWELKTEEHKRAFRKLVTERRKHHIEIETCHGKEMGNQRSEENEPTPDTREEDNFIL